jgi:hypothetical protein
MCVALTHIFAKSFIRRDLTVRYHNLRFHSK